MNTALCTELEHSLRDFYRDNPPYFHPFLWHEREALLAAAPAPAALVTAAVTLVVSTALKVGIRAWCQYYADRHPEEQA